MRRAIRGGSVMSAHNTDARRGGPPTKRAVHEVNRDSSQAHGPLDENFSNDLEPLRAEVARVSGLSLREPAKWVHESRGSLVDWPARDRYRVGLHARRDRRSSAARPQAGRPL